MVRQEARTLEFRKTVYLPVSDETAHERALAYWQERGFRFEATRGEEQVGQRGSLWGNLTSFDMSKLRATLAIIQDGSASIEFVLRVDTSFQIITSWNLRYWQWEIDRAESCLLRHDKQDAAWGKFEKQWRRAAWQWGLTGGMSEGTTMPDAPHVEERVPRRRSPLLALLFPLMILLMLCPNLRNASLLKAVETSDVPRAERLLARGADIETRDRSKWNSHSPRDWHEAEFTPLAYALEYHDKPIIQMLLAHGANINAKTTYDERFGTHDIILSTAVEAGDLETVRLLLDEGARVDVRAASDMTPLMMAVRNNRLEIVRLLIARGADVNARDDRGFTVLNFAMIKSRHDHSEVIRFLQNAGAH